MKIETSDQIVTYKDDQATKDALFVRVMRFFEETELFSGESLCQSDAMYISAPDLLSDIADDILQFETEEKE